MHMYLLKKQMQNKFARGGLQPKGKLQKELNRKEN